MKKIFELYYDLIESCYEKRLSKLEKLSPTNKLWDLIVITAISHDQKKCYEKQLEMKLQHRKLSNKLTYLVINDPDECKIGSGGSTMNVLKQLYSVYLNDLFKMKILLIHAGGYSQRMPNCSILGKIFSSISSESNYINDFLDIKLAIYTPFSVYMQPGVFLASSDDVITCDLDEQLEASKLFGLNNDFILLAHKSSLIIGKDHGVYAVDSSSKHFKFNAFNCKFVLQKPSIDKMLQMNVCLNDQSVLSDSCFYFTSQISKILLDFHESYFNEICANKIEIDAYRDFLQPLGSQPLSLNEYLNGLNLNNDLKINIFTKLYSLMSGRQSLVINLTDSIFYHLGTISELLDFYLNQSSQNAIQFRNNICFIRLKIKNVKNKSNEFDDLKGCVQNSIVNSMCKLSELSLMEHCLIDDDIELVLNDNCFLNNCMIKKSELKSNVVKLNVPPNVCMHTISIFDSNQLKYVTIFYNKNDDLKKVYNELKQVIFLGKSIDAKLAQSIKLTNQVNTIWNLKVFQAFDTMSESFVKSLDFVNDYLKIDYHNFNLNDLKCYSLFDLLRLQSYSSMLQFRYENGLV